MKLQVYDKSGKLLKTVPVGRDDINIGTRKRYPICLDDPEVDEFHAWIQPAKDKVEIDDMNSWHGTLLNGDKLGRTTVIKPGDVIGIGSFQIKVVDDDCISEYGPKPSKPSKPSKPFVSPAKPTEPTVTKKAEPAKVKEPKPEPASVAPRSMRLRVYKVDDMINVVQVKSDPISIGRLKSNTINDDSLDLERMHAVVEVDVAGIPRVINRGSLYGTQVNGEQIERATVIKDGDVLGVGPLTIKVEGSYSAPEPEAAQDTEPKSELEPDPDADEMKAATAALEAMEGLVKAAADMPVSAVTHVKAKCWDMLMDFWNDEKTPKDQVGSVIRTIRKIFGQ